jgi:hypothetical protein
MLSYYSSMYGRSPICYRITVVCTVAPQYDIVLQEYLQLYGRSPICYRITVVCTVAPQYVIVLR